jgi:Clostridium epsilon toxin ETX/Bacillus mosquitocidal toxin MTX2/Jacalin-like lectin domain
MQENNMRRMVLVMVVLAGFVVSALLEGLEATLASSGESARPGEFSSPQRTVSPEDLWWKTSSPTETGWIHEGCEKFADPEAVVSKGPISKIDVYHGGYIHGIRIWYGTDGVGLLHGYTEGIPMTEWKVPEGERITRIEGEIAGYYVSRLQFFTDGGHSSSQFGGTHGKRFVVADPAKGALRTISGYVNLRRHPSLNRAVASMTFQFGAPYFIKRIDYDLAALDAARRDTTPERCASQDFTNGTSVEQTSTYSNTLTVVKATTLTFEQSFGLTLGVSVWGEASAKLMGIGVKAGTEVSWEASASAKSGQSYSSRREETVSWSVPVRVPPHTRVVATSTWRKYRVSIPFTYTVAWYEGTRDHIKKEVTLPGLYEDVRVDDLKHEFAESRLK